MKHPIKISEAEWEVMNVVWSKPPIPSSDVVDQLSEKKGWAPRTIRTLLDRLVKKGALRADLDGKRYLYEPKVTMQDCVRHASRSFAERVFGGAPASMLIHLIEQSELTSDEIKELKRILSKKEK
jgi:BlaI family transcriptional regulator, penicillinase repressor